jgi:hypothetical protein
VTNPVTVNGDGPDIEAIRLDNGRYVWTWTSPGGACHQGPKQYRRAGDALNAGRQWLAGLKRV